MVVNIKKYACSNAVIYDSGRTLNSYTNGIGREY
jgi:hypothetical protein